MEHVAVLEDLSIAEKGSYYTILGVGGDLAEWVEGYTKNLVEAGIGTPMAWFQTNGAAVNYFAKPSNPRDEFKSDLTILMFPLDGLDTGKLAMFKIAWQDRWFDDVVENMRPQVRDDDEDE